MPPMNATLPTMGANTAAPQKEPKTPLRMTYSLFPRTFGNEDSDEYEISKMASLKTARAKKSNDKEHTAIQDKGGSILERLATLHDATESTADMKLQEKSNDTEKFNDWQDIFILERGRFMLSCIVS